MKENELNVNEIVKVESLGVIKQQLDKVEIFIDEKIKNIPETLEKIKKLSFVEQEDEKNDIKKYQQYLSKIQKELEDKRKEIKEEINKPYKEFEEYYKNGVYLKLDNSIKQIKEVVNEIETLQKDEKECELREFAQQYIDNNKLNDIIKFEDIGLNITLSASVKSLKEQICQFIGKIMADLDLINMEEYKDEIYVEYQKNLDFVKSKMLVVERHKQLEELKKQQEEKLEQEKQEEKVVEKVEEVVAPKEIIEDTEVITVSFTITDTKEKILKLRDYLKENGINYE